MTKNATKSFGLPFNLILVPRRVSHKNSKEMMAHLPSEQYQASRGQQNTWEVSFQGQHIAKRSYLKYGGEPAAAKHVLWEAWMHHRRRTGESCPIPWLNDMFQISDTTPLSQLVPAVCTKKGRKTKTPAAEPAARKKRKATTEPIGEAGRSSASTAGAKRKPKAKQPRRKKQTKRKKKEPSHESSDVEGTSSSTSSSSSSSSTASS